MAETGTSAAREGAAKQSHLKYVEGMSYEEIAGVLGCSKGTVASRLNRAHKALGKKLSHLRDQV